MSSAPPPSPPPAAHHPKKSHSAPVQPASRRRRPLRILIGLIGVVALGVLAWWVHASLSAPPPAAGGSGRRRQTGPLSVAAAPVRKGDINVYLTGLGTVVPFYNVTVRTQISGRLIKMGFDEGQMVNQGDLLAVVDPRPYQVALEQAKGQLKQAQAELKDAQIDYTRYVALSKQDSIAQQTVDKQIALVAQDEGLVQTAQSAVDNATLSLEYCHITAPVTGRMGLRQVDPGNYVTPGDANGLVTLMQVKPITVVFSLPEDNVPQVVQRLRDHAVLPVDVFDRSQSRQLASGTLLTIDNQVDATTGTFRLRAQFANEDESLFANQFVNVRMRLDVLKNTLIIPSAAVERGQQGTFVFVVKDDKTVASRPVVLGPTEGERVAVTSGLKPGELVVTEGADRLKDGVAINLQAKGAGGKGKKRPADGAPAEGPAGAAAAGKGGEGDGAPGKAAGSEAGGADGQAHGHSPAP